MWPPLQGFDEEEGRARIIGLVRQKGLASFASDPAYDEVVQEAGNLLIERAQTGLDNWKSFAAMCAEDRKERAASRTSPSMLGGMPRPGRKMKSVSKRH